METELGSIGVLQNRRRLGREETWMAPKVGNPDQLAPPMGRYSHVSRVSAGELVFVAGQVAIDASGAVVGKGDFVAQVRQAFDNVRIALESEGCGFDDVARFTTYLVHSQDIQTFHQLRTEIFANVYPEGAYPPNTLLIVDRLVSESFLIEIEAIAAVPP
jgi:enamine deaminase RidA (YjgF/YER057c/UK114 family)